MRSEDPPAIRLADYLVPDFLVDTVDLAIALHPTRTRVRAELAMRRNPAGFANTPVVLEGDELKLTGIMLDGKPLGPSHYTVAPDKLVIPGPPDSFVLTLETETDPSANTRLMGLYRSGGIYCTQCEAEGFRRITYFPDRPDVLATYRVRLEAEKSEAPVLLANGNLVERGDIADTGRHFAVWHDPFPKPCYLFAAVGGDLEALEDRHVTASGRDVALGIYVAKGETGRAAYAMDALKRSMRWDEEVFGLEYDLSVFNIVAVSDFIFGAMENKGLNIFNDKYVLASPETATDADYANIEAIIAHEYFHNWTGNRVTCRDWFQLCLKEGLTVFRDQEFSADMRSRPVKRIADVRNLRSQQFVEDAGPLAHPVRPATYREINNFYTVTVYEKGAELVRMIQTLLGEDRFRQGLDLYFERCDGTAATVEEFIAAFEAVSGRSLQAFMRWYHQAGTPTVSIAASHDLSTGTMTLTLRQSTPVTPGQATKEPFVIPIRLGLLSRDGAPQPITDSDGKRCEEMLVVLDSHEKSVVLGDVPQDAVVSALRGFSAPVILSMVQSDDDLATLAAHDGDPFNRWQALQTLATNRLLLSIASIRAGAGAVEPGTLVPVFGRIIERSLEDPAFAALSLMLPGEQDLAREIGQDVDPDAIATARRALRAALGTAHLGLLQETFATVVTNGVYLPDARGAGLRALRAVILDLIASGSKPVGIAHAQQLYAGANNMTDRMAALSSLCWHGETEREDALNAFETQFGGDALVMDKWFALQSTIPEPATLARVQKLMQHKGFSLTNPNRVRAVIGAFASGNPTQFHRADGKGYGLIADMVIKLDVINPQVAARLLTAFRTWKTMEPGRRAHALACLRRIDGTSSISPDVRDILIRTLE